MSLSGIERLAPTLDLSRVVISASGEMQPSEQETRMGIPCGPAPGNEAWWAEHNWDVQPGPWQPFALWRVRWQRFKRWWWPWWASTLPVLSQQQVRWRNEAAQASSEAHQFSEMLECTDDTLKQLYARAHAAPPDYPTPSELRHARQVPPPEVFTEPPPPATKPPPLGWP